MSHSAAELPDDLAFAVADPHAYADMDALHEKLKVIRRDHPFAQSHLPDYEPFWVASKFDDIQSVARQNTVFLSGKANLGTRTLAAVDAEARRSFRSIVAMNEPDHRVYRLLTQDWFMPKNLRKLGEGMRTLARRYIDRMADADGEIDFCDAVAVHYPLLVVMSILGVPPEDEPMMHRLTREFFGSDDDELSRHGSKTAEQVAASKLAAVADVTGYFKEVTRDRRANPTDDLATVIANSRIDGELIADIDCLGYYVTIAFAGHDTTSSSVAGGIWALAERPDQLAMVKADPSLVPGLVEESIRWTTPIHQFTRVAARDAEVRGQTVREGDWVVLSFPSGNRDDEVFEDPFAFRVDRTPNRHIAFGFGAHHCLGIHLARMEMAIFFEELLPRLKSLELAGTPRRMVTNFVGGPKYLPIRYRLD